jgi:quercetin dioxygenase-like cupin family protein
MPDPFASTPETAPTFSVVHDVYRVLARASDTGGALGLIDAIVPPGGGPPPHVHTREDEFFYILEGEVTFYIESAAAKAPIMARAGTFLFAPRNQKHRFRNETDKPARMLFGVLPGGFEGLFSDTGAKVTPGSTTPAPVNEPDLIRLAQLAAQKYGCHIDPPHK